MVFHWYRALFILGKGETRSSALYCIKQYSARSALYLLEPSLVRFLAPLSATT